MNALERHCAEIKRLKEEKSKSKSRYLICGMSVPPVMIKRIVTRLIESGIFKENDND